jgi:hypothetical protein
MLCGLMNFKSRLCKLFGTIQMWGPFTPVPLQSATASCHPRKERRLSQGKRSRHGGEG